MLETLHISVERQGLTEVTRQVDEVVNASMIGNGLCTLFIQHTSASLLIQENADPSARADFEAWMNRLVPENDPIYTHTQEGPDDMPAHIKSMLTQSSVAIPVINGRLALGTWQGIFLWEHRVRRTSRNLVVHLSKDK